MIITKQASSTDNVFLIAALLCLLLTSFPFAQGWISLGDFAPRVLFLAFVAISKPKLFMTKDVIWLGIFFIYIFFSGGARSLIQFSAVVMEFLVSIAISNYIIFCKNNNHMHTMAWYGIIVTIIIMVSTSVVDIMRPGIVREMVKFGYSDELGISQHYIRRGVCGYSFAMIGMCMGPVFLHISQTTNYKRYFLLCFAIVCYFVYITGITTCLLIFVFMMFVYIMNRRGNSVRSLLPSIIIIGLVTYFAGFFVVEFLMPYLEGTTFYTHLAGLMEFYGKSTMATEIYEVDDRVDLYEDSFVTFVSNPFFGNATGKIGAHSYFIDRLALFGIIGTALLFVFLYYRFRISLSFIPSTSHTVYVICIIGFFMLGFLKNMAGIDYWIYLFVYIPCMLRVMKEKKKRI